MVSRKYLKDYRVEETIDAKGRVKSEAVYIGVDYILSPPVSVGDRRLIALLTLLCWLAFFGALLLVTRTTRAMYVILPFTATALSMYLMSEAIVFLWRAGDVMTREKAEKISNRLPPCSIITAILALASFAGGIASTVISGGDAVSGDYIYIAISLAMSLASAVSFSKCRKVKAVRS